MGAHRQRATSAGGLTGESTLDGDEVTGLLDRGHDGLDIEGPDRPEVDDLDLDALLLFEDLGGLERVSDHLGVGDDGEVGSLLFHLGLADGEQKVLAHLLLGHGERDSVQQLVLEETDGVGIPDGGLEQSSAVGSAPGADDLETGDGSVPSGEILRVLSTDTGGGTVGTSEDDGAGDVSTRHVVGLSTRVDDLVNGLHGKVPSHCGARSRSCESSESPWSIPFDEVVDARLELTKLANGPQSGKRGSDGETGESRLGDGGLHVDDGAASGVSAPPVLTINANGPPAPRSHRIAGAVRLTSMTLSSPNRSNNPLVTL